MAQAKIFKEKMNLKSDCTYLATWLTQGGSYSFLEKKLSPLMQISSTCAEIWKIS